MLSALFNDPLFLKSFKADSCVQLCYRIDDLNMKRELHGLKSALEYFGLKEGVIVTHNQIDLFEDEGVTIRIIPAWKYMV